VDCPLNLLEITDNNKSIDGSKYIKLSNDKYLHYSNKNTDGKIIVQFQISQHYPCPNIDYDNNFCPILENCDNNKKGCNFIDYLKDKYIYEYLDYDLASNIIPDIDSSISNNSSYTDVFGTGLINNNNIKEKIRDGNYSAFDSNDRKIFILYKRSWIGYYNSEDEKEDFRESKSKLKNFAYIQRFCKRKNRALLAFSILILFSIIGKYILIYYFKTLDYLVYIDFGIIIFLFINWLLNSITISRYNSFNSDFFKFSIFNYFNHNEYNITKIEISLLFFNLIFFILEFVFFFYDFSQTENYLIKCWNKFINDKNKNPDLERMDTKENLITPNLDLYLDEINRIEEKEIEKLKNMDNEELIQYFNNKIKKLMKKKNNNINNNNLQVIQEVEDEENEQNESSQNINYDNILQTILNNKQSPYDYIISETLATNNNNNNDINNIDTALILRENNFSLAVSNFLRNEPSNLTNLPHGHFGFVRKFNFKGKNFILKIPNLKDKSNKQNMIKNIAEINQLENEIDLLEKFQHDNIVKFYKKKMIENEIPCMLLENCEGGDLKMVLENIQTTNKFKEKMMKQLAKALIYLHEKGYVHSDLKCDNILLDKPYNELNYPNLKLADFGCCVKIGEKYNNGHVFFRAIEILKNKNLKVSNKIDVYSYASTCYQIIKGKEPFNNDINNFKENLKSGNYFPDINDLNCSDNMKELLQQCWNENPNNRPDMKTVLKKLNQINIFENN
jgi:tRNA A-37 threonylcarbamoyl transferase component Bud32